VEIENEETKKNEKWGLDWGGETERGCEDPPRTSFLLLLFICRWLDLGRLSHHHHRSGTGFSLW
jgi:hypothetical protein